MDGATWKEMDIRFSATCIVPHRSNIDSVKFLRRLLKLGKYPELRWLCCPDDLDGGLSWMLKPTPFSHHSGDHFNGQLVDVLLEDGDFGCYVKACIANILVIEFMVDLENQHHVPRGDSQRADDCSVWSSWLAVWSLPITIGRY